MSPEQLAGTEVTVKSDIYALGLLLYELFTGRRAFDAASLMELMKLQEQAAPASITSVAKDLDPAAERVIMRCLDPDPRRRPSSVLAVAAGLPGGDPLAAAMAAGETPSPDLVVAAGETEGLAPRLAIAWLAAVLVGLVVVEALAPSQTLTAKLPLENSPEALSRDAQRLLRDFGYIARPADRAWSLSYHGDYVFDYINKHPAEAKSRWRNPAVGQPPLIHFWYRQSPAPMAAVRGFEVAVNFADPPMETSGMVRLRTDLDGKLQQFEAVPPQVEAPAAPPAPPFDWSKLFQAAGLDMSRFQPTDPQWSPLVNADARAAWTGTADSVSTPLRVEAAAWRGRPVFFRITGPWSVPEQNPAPAAKANQIPSLILVYLALISACIIAWRNVRAGKSDHRGALKMGGLYFLSMFGARLLFAHHTGTLAELDVFWKTVSLALINGGAVWVFYLALEPWVRRSWPHTLIGWNRFAAKGLRDPLVGRDLLYGMGFGSVLAGLLLVETAFHGNSGQPYLPDLDALNGVRYELSFLLNGLDNAVFAGLLSLFILFLLRAVLRKQWLAMILFVAISALAQAFGSSTPWVDYSVAAASAAVVAFVLLRFGLLAALSANACLQFLESCPPTMDFSSWYFGLAMIPPILVALIAIYGFRIALAGRPLIPES
jgi:serine/threonine-protein kinase